VSSKHPPDGGATADGATAEIDWAARGRDLRAGADLEAPLTDAVAGHLLSLVGSAPSAADVGTGGGGMARSHARLGARVDAVDRVAELLQQLLQQLDEPGVRAVPGELMALARPASGYDVVWAAAVLHHLPDQQVGVDHLASLLAPGGVLAVSEGGLPVRTLPRDLGVGRPALETRLDAAQAVWFEEQVRAGQPRMTYDWSTSLRRAGLAEVTSRTWLTDLPAPLGGLARRWVADRLTAARRRLGCHVAAEDVATLDRLLDEDDEMWVGRREDIFILSPRCVHLGRRESAPPPPR